VDRFGYDAANSGEMSRRRRRWSQARLGIGFVWSFTYLQKAENSGVNDTAALAREEYHGDLTTNFEIDPPGPIDAE
jgi:hypothetical protein